MKGISPAQFSQAIDSIFTGPLKLPEKIVVAVSGGVDSMALMYLACKTFLPRKIRVYGITIDHGLRKNSREEAIKVRKIVKAMGAQHYMVPINWKREISNSQLEIECRQERFRLLTQRARYLQTSHVFLAHTLDDQLETFVGRLVMGSTPRGLAGMLPVASYWIPPTPDEKESFKLVRPLLGFTKQQLIDTCLENEVPWFEDPTNKDTTLTSRNAIRYMFQQQEKLPQALRRDNLIETIEYLQQMRQSDNEAADQVYNLLLGKDKDGNCSKGSPQFVKLRETHGEVFFQEPNWFMNLKQPVQALVLRKMVDRILPGSSHGSKSVEGYAYSTFLKIAKKMGGFNANREERAFEILNETPSTKVPDKIQIETFTSSNLIWKLWAVPEVIEPLVAERALEVNTKSEKRENLEKTDSFDMTMDISDEMFLDGSYLVAEKSTNQKLSSKYNSKNTRFVYIWGVWKQQYGHFKRGLEHLKQTDQAVTVSRMRVDLLDQQKEKKWMLFDFRYWLNAQVVGNPKNNVSKSKDNSERKPKFHFDLEVSYPLCSKYEMPLMRDFIYSSVAGKWNKINFPTDNTDTKAKNTNEIQDRNFIASLTDNVIWNQPTVFISYQGKREIVGFPMFARNQTIKIPVKELVNKIKNLGNPSPAQSHELKSMAKLFEGCFVEIECQLKQESSLLSVSE